MKKLITLLLLLGMFAIGQTALANEIPSYGNPKQLRVGLAHQNPMATVEEAWGIVTVREIYFFHGKWDIKLEHPKWNYYEDWMLWEEGTIHQYFELGFYEKQYKIWYRLSSWNEPFLRQELKVSYYPDIHETEIIRTTLWLKGKWLEYIQQ